MTKAKEFDLLNAPLEGTNLIEASAGTGKTYTIAGVFLRLVLEKNLSVDEILVVTFTQAATEELKERIRTKLGQAAEAFSAGHSQDSFLNHLIRTQGGSKVASRHLREALQAFDQAAIFTIHGFCRRMLYENAFESGSLFDTELLTDQENLKREIVDDFWRTHFYNESPLFVYYAMHNRFSPDRLLSLLGNERLQPHLSVIPQSKMPSSSVQEKGFQESFRKVRRAWQSARAEVERILTTDQGLDRNKYRKTSIPVWLHRMDDYLTSEGNDSELFLGFEKFTTRELQAATKKSHPPPAHPFFELCEDLRENQQELQAIFQQRLLNLKVKLFDYARNELISRKEERNVQCFDDLLLRVHRALGEKRGKALAGAMRMKFKAALIDEFQDTDPIQYAIFDKVFGTQKSILFLIGDPKQAIYSFRGADIFAYMQAATRVKYKHTLAENWRSEPDLITAVNAIFSNADCPFVYDWIPFQSSVPAKTEDLEPLIIDGASEPPFQFWLYPGPTSSPDAGRRPQPKAEITKTLARVCIGKAVAAEISRLLSLGRDNKALLGNRPLRPGDIAVLVRRNAEARLIQQALSTLHIPSVLCRTGNLFDSHEAMEMERVLTGISEPNHEKRLKAALATDLMGVKGEDIDRLAEDDAAWEEWLVKFRRYHDLWNERGFIRMFRYLLLEERVLPRLMSFRDGERRSTNVLHLSEVLHQASIERKLAVAGLLKWLSEQRDPNTPRLDEHQLRLETDENAVKLVTVHKSKGLEYPVVFCPFAWDGSRISRKKYPFTFHDQANNLRPTLDLGSEHMDKNLLLAEKELLAENLRLLYVALTRARSRCYFVWGRFRDAETSAPAYLLHQPTSWEAASVVSAVGERFRSLRDEHMLEELETIPTKAEGTVRLSEMPAETHEAYLPPRKETMRLTSRKFSGNIDRSWQISSFSSLVSGQFHGTDLADRDATSLADSYDQAILGRTVAQVPLGDSLTGIFAFPKGTKAGTFMHDILEHLDFAQQDTSEAETLVTDKLKEYGFECIWRETVLSMIQKVLSAPLDPTRKDFTLSRISNADRLNELAFYFPLQSISPVKLKSLFEECAGHELMVGFPEQIERLHFAPVRGFMKGFMDMVFQFEDRFYLVDWKSNFLGPVVEDYGQKALAGVMEEAFYILQYHIYTIALNQYLHLRLPHYNYEAHFGGVYYIFLRGVDPDKGSDFGIFRARPPEPVINELSANLIHQID